MHVFKNTCMCGYESQAAESAFIYTFLTSKSLNEYINNIISYNILIINIKSIFMMNIRVKVNNLFLKL